MELDHEVFPIDFIRSLVAVLAQSKPYGSDGMVAAAFELAGATTEDCAADSASGGLLVIAVL
ncbi:MAG: hypothetical protein CMO26_21120 [Thiotrichales bacterium]|nr:hypothetical protein [Thiotrichales bacterium]